MEMKKTKAFLYLTDAYILDAKKGGLMHDEEGGGARGPSCAIIFCF